MAIIINNAPRVIVCPDGNKTVRMFSGPNLIPDEIWLRVRPNLTDRIGAASEDKTFTEIGMEVKGEKGKQTFTFKSLAQLEVKAASAVIEKCLDVEALEKWKHEVSREDLRLQILNRIEFMLKR